MGWHPPKNTKKRELSVYMVGGANRIRSGLEPAHEVSLAGAVGRPRLSATTLKQPAMLLSAMSALKRITDSSRTSRHVRNVPKAEVSMRPHDVRKILKADSEDQSRRRGSNGPHRSRLERFRSANYAAQAHVLGSSFATIRKRGGRGPTRAASCFLPSHADLRWRYLRRPTAFHTLAPATVKQFTLTLRDLR
jgi:hypothetical protein